MEIYVARQPILNRKQEIHAYELLYRNNNEQNMFSQIDAEKATSDVLNSIIQIGINDLSDGKPCFVNFTEKLLGEITPVLFQPETMVIEVLETVIPNEKIIDNCKTLKQLGYKIALDDFRMQTNNTHFIHLIKLADIIKIDIQSTSREKQLKIINNFAREKVQFLAEKVETRTEYLQCLQDGYQYFQGYFFSKPVILSSKDVPFQSHNFYLILEELSKKEPDVNKITKIFESDLSLTYKLLKLVNSLLFSRYRSIKSIKQAVVLLGFEELKKWIYLLSLRDGAQRKSASVNEVVKMSFVRGKTSELIAIEMGRAKDSSSYFLMGMLSLIDTVMQQGLENILKQLPLDPTIKETLLGEQTCYSDILRLVIAMERAEWHKITELANKIGIQKQVLFKCYKESTKWAKKIIENSMNENNLDEKFKR